METMTWNEYLDFLEDNATTKSELESVELLRAGSETKKEYKLTSSIARGINEQYYNKEELIERINYIETHKEEFKNSRMIYVYEYTYNENGKIVDNKTLSMIDCR